MAFWPRRALWNTAGRCCRNQLFQRCRISGRRCGARSVGLSGWRILANVLLLGQIGSVASSVQDGRRLQRATVLLAFQERCSIFDRLIDASGAELGAKATRRHVGAEASPTSGVVYSRNAALEHRWGECIPCVATLDATHLPDGQRPAHERIASRRRLWFCRLQSHRLCRSRRAKGYALVPVGLPCHRQHPHDI